MAIIKTLKQGIMFPKNFIAGRFKKSSDTAETLRNGEGAIVDEAGKKVGYAHVMVQSSTQRVQ